MDDEEAFEHYDVPVNREPADGPPHRRPDNYFPYGPEDGIEEGDLRLFAWQPANNEAEQCFILRVFRGEEQIAEAKVPMYHPNLFGVDVEDHANLEAATDKLLIRLREEEKDGH